MMKLRDLQIAFDVGHSSIGWGILLISVEEPRLLGCGSVIFPVNDCLASERRGFRRQRRHIRATRLRIARLKRLLVHLGVLTDTQLETNPRSWPWLLAARVLRGGKTLTWSELWDVLRWYAHNRGYDGNKGWSRHEAASAEDTEKEKEAHRLLDDFAKKHGRSGTMAEVFCDVLGVDPLGEVKSSRMRVRNLGAAFPREGVEAEVERILRAHLSMLDEKFIEAVLRDHTAISGPDYRLPARYGQRLADGSRSPGGLLFGQLIPRFDNRIIARCPITFERIYQEVKSEAGDEKRAHDEAEKRAKVPGIGCAEFLRFRWAMQLANVQIAAGPGRQPRSLSAVERIAVHAEMEKHGHLDKRQFKAAVRAHTAKAPDNLDRLLALDEADRSLVLDPARKLAGFGMLGALWPHFTDSAQRHLLTDLRRGKSITARALLAATPAAESAFTRWWDGEAMKKLRKNQVARTREQALGERHKLDPANGRAPYTREVMREVFDFVLSTDRHPAEEGGPLYRSEAIRHAQLQRALDEQTNNHLVRHRLKLLERLHDDLLKEYAANDPARIERLTIEVNRDVKEMSGKTAQEQAKIQNQKTFTFRTVEKRLAAAYEGKGVHLGPGLIRKGRIAEDLGWKCPYTGASYDEFQLLHRKVDKDHIVPRSLRPSDSLDSLVITFAEINKWKGQRTAVRFVEEEQGKTVPGLPHLMIKPLARYLDDVKGLDERKGHDDDQRRKKNRKRLLALRDYVEKEFTPGDLTQTSQLVRLAAQALQRHYLGAKQPPVVTSLPGSVTGAVRKSWNLLGCLATANPQVLDPTNLDENNRPKVRTKTEIRGITHLHHALDACILAFASHFLPRDGATWNKEVVLLLHKRRLTTAESALLRSVLAHHVQITTEGEPRLKELPSALKDELRQRLAERRVVQHLPRDLSGLNAKETVWRVFDPADTHLNSQRLGRWLAEKKIPIPAPDAKTALIICRKRRAAGVVEGESAGGKVFRETKTWRWVYDIKDKSALLGFAPEGDLANAKLKRIKAVKVLGDNFGLALDPEPTLIRPHKVWHQLEKLRLANGGKPSRVLRKGTLIHVPMKGLRPQYEGIWMVRGVTLNQRAGFLVDLSPADQITYRGIPGCCSNVSLATLRKCGLEVLPTPLSGVPLAKSSPPEKA